jgi:hypothetical protein
MSESAEASKEENRKTDKSTSAITRFAGQDIAIQLIGKSIHEC